MDTTSHIVTLGNGKQVSWEEFSNWSSYQQRTIKPFKNTGSNNGSSRPVMTPDGKFDSMIEACRFYGVTRTFLSYRLKSKKYSDFYFLTTSQNPMHDKNNGPKAVITPFGRFNSIKSAADQYCVTEAVMKNWIKSTTKRCFSFDLKNPSTHSRSRRVLTPAGEFQSVAAAARFYGVSNCVITNGVRGVGQFANLITSL
jgi:hypothetical protein